VLVATFALVVLVAELVPEPPEPPEPPVPSTMMHAVLPTIEATAADPTPRLPTR
jgi:hypothetical protein